MKGKSFTNRLRRIAFGQNELLRNSLRFITHTEAVPMPKATTAQHMTRRCVLTGRGKSVLREFNLCRHAFRKLALDGQVPGVQKAIW